MGWLEGVAILSAVVVVVTVASVNDYQKEKQFRKFFFVCVCAQKDLILCALYLCHIYVMYIMFFRVLGMYHVYVMDIMF